MFDWKRAGSWQAVKECSLLSTTGTNLEKISQIWAPDIFMKKKISCINAGSLLQLLRNVAILLLYSLSYLSKWIGHVRMTEGRMMRSCTKIQLTVDDWYRFREPQSNMRSWRFHEEEHFMDQYRELNVILTECSNLTTLLPFVSDEMNRSCWPQSMPDHEKLYKNEIDCRRLVTI